MVLKSKFKDFEGYIQWPAGNSWDQELQFQNNFKVVGLSYKHHFEKPSRHII